MRNSEGLTFFIMQNHFDDYVPVTWSWVLTCEGRVCMCVFLTSGVLFVSEDTVEEGNTKQPRAVLASEIYPPIFLRQICVSVIKRLKPGNTAINVLRVCPV